MESGGASKFDSVSVPVCCHCQPGFQGRSPGNRTTTESAAARITAGVRSAAGAGGRQSRGNYLVLSGSMYLSFITLPDLKIVKSLSLGEKKSRMDHRGLNSSDDGQTLYALIDVAGYDYPTEQESADAVYDGHPG